MIPATYTPTKSLRSENEELVLLFFETAPKANDRIYLQMNSDLDDSLIVGIQAHYNLNILGVFQYDISSPFNYNGQNYNVIDYADLQGCTLTIVDKGRRQCLSNFPLQNLSDLPAGQGFPNNTQNFKKFSLDILSGESYVTFNVNANTSPPFILPISFLYNDKK